jgi:tetratricopeptide (TPR) repeat protein
MAGEVEDMDYAVPNRSASRSNCLQARPRRAEVRLFAGLAKFHLGKEEEAVAWLRRSIETNRSFPSSYFVLAAALARLGRLSEARLEAQAGLAINPTFTISRFRSGLSIDDPTAIAAQERYIDGLRKAGVSEA